MDKDLKKLKDLVTEIKKTVTKHTRSITALQKSNTDLKTKFDGLEKDSKGIDIKAVLEAQAEANEGFLKQVGELSTALNGLGADVEAIQGGNIDPGKLTELMDRLKYCEGICQQIAHLAGRVPVPVSADTPELPDTSRKA